MFSENINIWDADPVLLQEPKYPWEFVQLGNSGSPLETEYGWLVITHGVGAMRKYCLGAIMLDLNDPTKIIGQITEPILMPNEQEREGYVPNVVYSCGSIINNNELMIPYAMSDYSSGFATIAMDDLLQKLVPADILSQKRKGTKKILLVDDDAMTREIITEVLKSGGYAADVVSDGIQAIIEISQNDYDLILSDISMPNFNGYQLLEFLKEKNIGIPVVFLTSYISQEEEIKGLKLGAVEYLKKPVDADLLLLRLNNIFNN
jgi:CheY-like chemotaxis protein